MVAGIHAVVLHCSAVAARDDMVGLQNQWRVLAFTSLFSVASMASLVKGVQEYRVFADATYKYVVNSFLPQCFLERNSKYCLDFHRDAALNCYEVVTLSTESESESILGTYLKPVTAVQDPWFQNRWFMSYTIMCFASLGVCLAWCSALWSATHLVVGSRSDVQHGTSAKTASETSLPHRRQYSVGYTPKQEQGLYNAVLAWIASVPVVAWTFAPLPISRLLSFVGFAHNFVEWWLIHQLVVSQFRGATRTVAKAFIIIWVCSEYAGSVLLGSLHDQWVVFGIMGAFADLCLFLATLRWYFRCPTAHRRQFLLAVSCHCVYVILFFLKCAVMPPAGKGLALYLNTAALWFATRFLDSREPPSQSLLRSLPAGPVVPSFFDRQARRSVSAESISLSDRENDTDTDDEPDEPDYRDMILKKRMTKLRRHSASSSALDILRAQTEIMFRSS